MSEVAEEEPPTPLVRGVVLTHGAMSFGMVDAVRTIAGADDDALVALSNQGCGPEELMRLVNEAVGEGPALVFTDMQIGSCAVAARFACRDPDRRQVVFGVNLPMLLDFVFHRDMSLQELVERLVERGRTAIRALEVPEPSTRDDRTPAGR